MHAGDVLDLFIIVKIVGCAARSAFGRRAEPERSEGGWSEAQRSGAKWRGRGLGQRNSELYVNLLLFFAL